MRFAILNAQGLVVGTMTSPTREDAEMSCVGFGEVFDLSHIEADVQPEEWALVDGDLVRIPQRNLPWLDWDGTQWRDLRDEQQALIDLSNARARSMKEINQIRGSTRTMFITAIPGQDMVYQEKERVARAWMTELMTTGQDPDPADNPGIMAEVGPGLTGETPYQVAFIYLYKADLWRHISPIIENVSIRYLNMAEVETDQGRLAALPAEFQAEMNLHLWEFFNA